MVIVRPHLDQPGAFQILDGHHRVEVLCGLGHTEVRCDVWAADDREAKLPLATLSRLQGQDSPIRRVQLLHGFHGEMSIGDLAGMLSSSSIWRTQGGQASICGERTTDRDLAPCEHADDCGADVPE